MKEQYTDQLKDFDAFAYGVQLRKDNKEHDMDTDITLSYYGGCNDSPAWAELIRIYKEVERGWNHQDNVFAKEKYGSFVIDSINWFKLMFWWYSKILRKP